MIIKNLRKTKSNGTSRISANLDWEDSDHPVKEIFFETDSQFDQALTESAHPFLVATLAPALWAGEQRIKVENSICPVLNENLENAQWRQLEWYGNFRSPISIEANTNRLSNSNGKKLTSASFLSGGLDSLFTLRDNRVRYPSDHPASIRTGILVHGFDIGGYMELGTQDKNFELAKESLQPIVDSEHMELIPIATNIRHLNNELSFWMKQHHGAALAAVGHALSNKISRVSIGSSWNRLKWGSSALLDPLYSSYDLQVIHHGSRYTRMEKAALVSDWDTALDYMRVCPVNPPGKLNCGKCEKCLRTELMLLALGKLAKASAFEADDLLPSDLENILVREQSIIMYQDILPGLKSQGRDDLVTAVKVLIHRSKSNIAWHNLEGNDIKSRVRRLDKKYLNGIISELYGKVRP